MTTSQDVLARHTNKKWAGSVVNACDECGETWPCDAVLMARAAAAAEELLRAEDAVRDAINGLGHEGTPHDDAFWMEPLPWERVG